MTVQTPNYIAKPFLKWVGGKSQLLPELVRNLPTWNGSYWEPFLGGGALFFELAAKSLFKKANLSDINESLIGVYRAVRNEVDEVIRVLKSHRYDPEHYYSVRSLNPVKLSTAERAARVIYLNKTCFNGLYRENSRGEFNVPFGRHKNPNFCDEDNLRAVSKVLQKAKLSAVPFHEIVAKAKAGDFIYFDPPYVPVSDTANFTSYSQNGFGREDQELLRDTFRKLDSRGVCVMLSNSDTPLVRKLYQEFQISTVMASRSVNCKGNSRGKVAEVIVKNYDV